MLTSDHNDVSEITNEKKTGIKFAFNNLVRLFDFKFNGFRWMRFVICNLINI